MASRWMDRFGNVFMLLLQYTIIVNCAGAIMMGFQSSTLLSNHSSSSVSANHAISWFASAIIGSSVSYQPCDSNQQLRFGSLFKNRTLSMISNALRLHFRHTRICKHSSELKSKRSTRTNERMARQCANTFAFAWDVISRARTPNTINHSYKMIEILQTIERGLHERM
jgi:hypothetical protein